jgi:hypothetical protein
MRPLAIDYELLERKMSRPRVREDLEHAQIRDVDHLLSMFLFGERALEEFVRGIEPITDDRTVVDFRMPRFIGSAFGLGWSSSLNVRAGELRPLGISRERGLYYYRRRESILPYLVNIGDRDPAELEARILEQPRSRGLGAPMIPESEWRR